MGPKTHRWLAVVLTAALVACPEPEDAPDAGAGATPVAHLQKVAGKVTLERGGQRGAAELGYLYVGDAIETGAQSSAVVRFGGGRLVEVGADARFVVAEKDGGLVLEVARGFVLSRIPSKAALAPGEGQDATVALSIVTPFGVTRVGTGDNSVSIDVNKERARVEVLAGEVELISRNGKLARADLGAKAELGVGDVTISRPSVELSPMAVEIVSVTGRAELRRKDKKRWEVVGKAGATLASGDSIRGKDGRTTLRPQGGKLSLAFTPGTELTLVDSGKAGNVEEAKVELARGTLELDLPVAERSRVTVGTLQLESELGGRVTVSKTGDGLAVSSFTGDVTARSGEKEQVVRAGEQALMKTSGEVQAASLDRPALVLPPKGGLKVFHPGIDRALLSWEGEPGDYRVVVSSDGQHTQPVLGGVVHAAEAVIPVPARGTLYWKVLAAQGDTEVAKGSATFSPEPTQKDLARLRNEVEDGSERTTIYFQDKPPAVTFQYKPEDKAVQYHLQVYAFGALEKTLAEKMSKDVSVALEAGALGEGKYLWQVTPQDAAGKPLRAGRMNRLEITYDNSVPSIVVKAPRNGDVVRGATIPVSGIAPLGTKVFANGKSLPLDGKHRFDAQASPTGRPPLIIFRTARGNGADVFTIRTLRRAR